MLKSNSKLTTNHPILLIEDDHHYAKLVEIYLLEAELLNCTITHCPSLQLGMDELMAKPGHYAVVLLDLSLPDSQGFSTLYNLLTHFPKLNVIVMTGQSDKRLGVEAVKAGAQDFLVKGKFDEDQLAKALRYSIERNNILLRLEETQGLAHIGHWECSPSEHIFNASDEVYRIFGRPFKHPLTCEDILKESSPFHLFMELQEEAEQGEKIQKDCWIKREDEEERFVSLTCTGTKTEEGHYIFYGIIQDITERKQAEELRKARDLAEQTARVREQFIASISHEMRTPMNAISGMSHLLMKTGLSGEQEEFIVSIQKSSEVLLGIINDILDASAIQNEQLKFTNHYFHLRELFYQLINLMKHKASEKKLGLELNIAPNVPDHFCGDSVRLNQILYNLVGNAIKFTDEGKVVIEVILIDNTAEMARLKVLIKDTGIGIKEDTIDDIFKPFSRVLHPGRIYEGTGLGLPITQSLVEQQGGVIGVKSKFGEGSTFYFEISYKKELPENKDFLTNALPVTSFDEPFSILLVEDHKMNQLVAKKTLEKQWPKVHVHIADDGEAAIQFLLQHPPVDIILMDIQMPRRDGFSTTQYIREKMNAPQSKIPILAMTAHANVTAHEQYKKAHFDSFVLKPFDPDELFKKIQYHLQL